MSIRILAAGLSTWIEDKMVAPSFVTVIAFLACSSPILTRILSIPLGPRVVLTKSATAIAPTNDCYNMIRLNFVKICAFLSFNVNNTTKKWRNWCHCRFKLVGKKYFTYKSCHFSAVFRSTTLQNLRKDILNSFS